MTKLTGNLTRETNVTVLDSSGKERVLAVTLSPNEAGDRIVLRSKGTKTDIHVSLADVWKLAVAPLNSCHDCEKELNSRLGDSGKRGVK